MARTLMNPNAVCHDADVLNLPLCEALGKAKAGVEKQLSGERKDDKYAVADKALIYLLPGNAG